MSDRTPHERQNAPAAPKREPQVLSSDELIVYEAIATLRGPIGVDGLAATTGLEEGTVRAAVDRLTALEMVETGDQGTRIGPNDWDVRGAR
ncbi:hypothetical protein [Actinoallomurus acaciae]|uniref:Uncharacterized protein n=1 Tax=Actinoallomurus acaciae TaxID=502577 RepID=A0ABV5YRY1_9ACTN